MNELQVISKLELEDIKTQVRRIRTNFSITRTTDELIEYSELLLERLLDNDISKEKLGYATDFFIDNTEGNNFNKLPSVGDFLKIINEYGSQFNKIDYGTGREWTPEEEDFLTL